MEKQHLQELDYGITMAVNTVVTAMGMQAENDQRKHRGESMAYTKSDFDDLINKNGTHHNDILTRWEGIMS